MSKLDKIDIDELINRVDTVYGTQGQSVSEPGAVSPAIQPTEQTPQVSLLESILRGGVQGATLDYADEMTGGMQALGDIALSDSTMQDLPELYRKYRDESRANYDAAQEANPVAYGASQVGGGVLSTVVPVGLASKGALATAKGAAALGGLAGLGASDADLTKGDVVGATGDVALGAGLGVAGQKIGSAIASSETGKAIGKKLTDTLTSKATKFEEAGSAQIAKLLGGGKGDVKSRLKLLNKQLQLEESVYGKDHLKERIAKLSGGVAVIKVGASTESELKELKLRVEDAVSATKAAVEEGIVPGGAITYFHLREKIKKLKLDKEEMVGANILYNALGEPIRRLLINSGASTKVIKKIKKEPGRWFDRRWNATASKYTFANGSEIEFCSADNDAKLRGARRD